jgi:hypothetical protein
MFDSPAVQEKSWRNPRTLEEARSWFSNEDHCVEYLASRRWPDGVVRCPHCGGSRVGYLASRRIWECRSSKHPNAQFSVRVGTMFEDSHIRLDRWLIAIWMLSNSKAKISSYEMARRLGITQKSAWSMLQRIEAALRLRQFPVPVRASGA